MLSIATCLNDKIVRGNKNNVKLIKAKIKDKQNGYKFHPPMTVLTESQSCELLPLVAAQSFIKFSH